MIKIIAAIAFSASFLQLKSQVGIGTPTPNPSAQLEISSTTKGTLIARMTTAQRKAIISPAPGLLVYDTEKKTIYIFDNNRWQAMMVATSDNKVPPQPAQANDGGSTDEFGRMVRVSGNYAIAGAPSHTHSMSEQGAAYIYFRDNGAWTMQAELLASDPQANGRFGWSVDISGDYAIVGAFNSSFGGTTYGKAYVFTRSGTVWTQRGLLIPGDGLANDNFGWSVSINGNFAIVGSPNDDGPAGADQGSAYIYDGSFGWIFGQGPQAKLTASDAAATDHFGYSVDINGDYVIVGSYNDDVSVSNQGSAYVYFKGSGWTFGQAHQSKLIASSPVIDDQFGYSVAITPSIAIVGAPMREGGGGVIDAGAVFRFSRSGITWSPNSSFSPSDAVANMFFGGDVAVDGSVLLVGAMFDDAGPFNNSGSVYLCTNETSSSIQILRKINDDNPNVGGRFGSSVGISGQNIIFGASGKSILKGEIAFLNIE